MTLNSFAAGFCLAFAIVHATDRDLLRAVICAGLSAVNIAIVFGAAA